MAEVSTGGGSATSGGSDFVGNDSIEGALGDGVSNAIVGKENQQVISSPNQTLNVSGNDQLAQIYQAITQSHLVLLDFKQDFSLRINALQQQMVIDAKATATALDTLGRRVNTLEDALQAQRAQIGEMRVGDQERRSQIQIIQDKSQSMDTKLNTLAAQVAVFVTSRSQQLESAQMSQFTAPLWFWVTLIAVISGAIIVIGFGLFLRGGP